MFLEEKSGHQKVQRTDGWLKHWQTDGTLDALQARILGIGSERGLINWNFGAIDGSFPP